MIYYIIIHHLMPYTTNLAMYGEQKLPKYMQNRILGKGKGEKKIFQLHSFIHVSICGFQNICKADSELTFHNSFTSFELV